MNLNPPYPPFSKGGTARGSFESPPLTKRDLGGLENLRTEGIYGNGYKVVEINGLVQDDKKTILPEALSATSIGGGRGWGVPAFGAVAGTGAKWRIGPEKKGE
jgi:hypothetical protein